MRCSRSALVLLGLLLATAASGCGGSSEESGPPQAPDHLADGRKTVIFEPGPIALSGPTRDPTLDEVAEFGIDTVRVALTWQGVVATDVPPGFDPSDPAEPHYDFSAYDGFMRATAARNLKVVMTISGPPPLWATDGGSVDSPPDPAQFGDFVTAVARRYSGEFDPDGSGGAGPLPAPTMWSVWNEPNLSIFLQPQLRDGAPYSPILYRKLYLAAQGSIEAVDPQAQLLIGETAPTRGLDGVDPIPFAEGVLCLDPTAAADPACDSGHIDAVGWATHPYGTRGTPPFVDPPGPDFVTFPSLANLEGVLDDGAGAGQIADDLPVYITEYGIQSKPDPLVGVPLQTQADWLSISEELAYADPRIRSYAQYLMRDDPPDRVPGTKYGGFESGLRFWNGPKKPSYDSFRLPLVVRRHGDKVSIWGLIRPVQGATTAEIRAKDGGVEKTLRSVDTDEAGVLTLESDYQQGRLWQIRWQSPDGETFEGPWTRSYSFELPAP